MSANLEPESEPTRLQLWREYERRKAELPEGLTSKEYFDACQKIADELGI